MRVTGPTLRRRNHAWLEMRSRERAARRLARRQEEADDENDADEEGESSDDALDADSSGDESGDAIDSSDDEADEDGGVLPPPAGTTSVGAGAGAQIGGMRPPAATPLPGSGVRIIPGNTLSAGDGVGEEVESDTDGEESADETSSPPPGVTATATTASITESSPQPTLSTAPLVLPIASQSSSSSLDELVTSPAETVPTQMPTLSLTPITSATNGPSPTVPATGATQSGGLAGIPADGQADQQGESLGASPSEQSGVNTGTAAGIVIGILALIGLFVGAAFVWRKWRRDRGLPFLPSRGDKLEDESYSPDTGGPIPSGIGIHDPAKTNTKIMDNLMTAAYATNNGRNDMEGAFMDEKAYAALAGPPTPQRSKPVVEWLDDVRSPTQSNGPGMPPPPEVPPSATLPRPGLPISSGRIPEPPRPAYHGRDTMTTDTTNTSVRWYG